MQVQIRIRDSKFKQILKYDSVTIPAGDLKCMDFPLAEEPNFGTWRIDVNFKIPEETGGCRPFYSAPSASCSFKVEEFVLPRFEVTLKAPEQLERTDDKIEVVVNAVYVFGENVQGSVKINATLESSGRRESLAFFDKTSSLSNGQYTATISSEEYRQMVRYRYDPFCVKSSIKVTAEVKEAGRGTKIAESITIPLVVSPIDVKFADDNLKVFRPGLNYSMKALASLADGSPAIGVDVKVLVTINNGKSTIFDDDITTSNDGSINVQVPVPFDTNCMKISLKPTGDSAGACTVEQECFSPSPMYSPTKSFLQLSDISVRSRRPHSRVDIFAQSTVPFTYLHLLVISQGSIQEHTYNVARQGATSATVSFRVTHQMVPKVKVLGLFAREDGELVADLIEVDIRCSLENQVNLAFSDDIVEPGDAVSITTTTTPNSVVLLSVVDKSLTLLAEACKSLEKENVCRLLRQLTHGSLFGGQSCKAATEGRCCPESCSEPTFFGVDNILNAAGVSLYSNMFRPRPPTRPTPPPVFPPFRPDFEFIRGPDDQLPVVVPTGAPGVVPIEREGGGETAEARVFFPESWVFQLLKANDEGEAKYNSFAPDTITTWFGEAYSLSHGTGLGISRQSQIKVSKPFFVSLELPFSVNFGESVTITPLVFFFGRRASTVATVSVAVDDDLDIVENSLPTSGSLSIERGSSSPFSLKLHPRAIGQLSITISAVSDGGETDVVKKALFVKPGCDKFDITENIFAEGTGQYCFNYSLPSCVIPGSASAAISVTGDLMSPPNLDRLLVLPTGCGEQNLVRTAINWVVAEYLVTTRQLQDFIAVKIRNNIMTGYQRQLNYLQGTGCFAIWPRSDCSLWLTAAVVDVFSGIVEFYNNQEPGTELIDMTVIDGALNYIIRNQRKSGELPIVGRVHNFGLFRNSGSLAHTAFGIVALKQYMQSFPTSSNLMRTRDAVQKAEEFLESEYEEETEFCNYGLALSTFALHKTVASSGRRIRGRLVADLRRRITTSKMFPGTCFLCPGCPSDLGLDETDGGTDCTGRPRNEGSAACVETTAYTLLALREAEDTQFTVCLAQWLIKIRSGSGGFYSSQDTVVAMKALAGFAEDTYTRRLNKQISFEIPSLASVEPLNINGRNRYERNVVNVPIVPSTGNCINWSGSGTAIIQSTLTYHGCDCCADLRAFSLELATDKRSTPLGTLLEVSVRIRYLGGKSSNMALVDVEIPSGYTFSQYEFEDDIVGSAALERFETKGTSVVFYFNNVPGNVATTFTVEFSRSFIVENPQQIPVTVYDYYDPGQAVTRYYLPVTTSPLPPIEPPRPITPPGPEPTGPPPPPGPPGVLPE